MVNIVTAMNGARIRFRLARRWRVTTIRINSYRETFLFDYGDALGTLTAYLRLERELGGPVMVKLHEFVDGEWLLNYDPDGWASDFREPRSLFKRPTLITRVHWTLLEWLGLLSPEWRRNL